MMLSNTESCLFRLQSDKIKDRTQGLADFVEIFAQESYIRSNVKDWTRGLLSIFTIINIEKENNSRKPTPACISRINLAASAVCQTIELGAKYLSRKDVRQITQHLGRLVIDDQRLYKPIARDFCKSYLAIISHHSNVQSLSKGRWEEWMSIACAAVIGDRIQPDKFQISGKIPFFSDTSQDDPIDALKKFDSTFNSSKLDRGISVELIDFMNCINVLLHTPTTVLVTNSSTLLTFFVRFFCTYSSETDAHLIASTALVRLISEIELNKPDDLHRFAPFLWKLLCAHWKTKQVNLKEQIAICLRFLLPVISNKILLQTASKALVDEQFNNPCLEPLSLDNLSIISPDTTFNGPFKTSSIHARNNLSPSQALSWMVIELTADIVLKLHSIPIHSTSESPGKRRKPLDYLTEQLNSLRPYWQTRPSIRNSSIVVYRLQILFFGLEKQQYSNIQPFLLRELINGFVELLAADNNIQSWSLICLGVLAKFQSQEISSPSSLEADSHMVGWLPVWNFCIARMSNMSTSRAAAFALCVMIEFQRISNITLRNDMKNIIQELNIQGPPLICDSTLTFFQYCLNFGDSDMKLARSDMRDQITQWLFNYWRPLDFYNNALSSSENKTVFILNLLLALSSVPDRHPVRYFEGSFPACSSTSIVEYWYQNFEIREYIFNARLPKQNESSKNSAPKPISKNVTGDAQQKKIASYLSRLIDQAISIHETPTQEINNSKNSGITISTIMCSCELVIISLLFEAHLRLNSIFLTRTLVSSSSTLLDKIFSLTLNSKLRFLDVLKSLNPIMVPLSHRYLPLKNSLLSPGLYSDMDVKMKSSTSSSMDIIDCHYSSVMDTLWIQEETSSVLNHLISRASNILHNNEDNLTEPDDFGRASQNKKLATKNDKLEEDLKLQCIRIILTGVKSFNNKNKRWNDIIFDMVIEFNASTLIDLGGHFARAIELGHLQVSADYIEKCLEKVGNEVLNDSDLVLNVKTHYFVLSLLDATISMWIDRFCVCRGKALELFNWCLTQYQHVFSPQSRILLARLLCSFIQRTSSNELEDAASLLRTEDEENQVSYGAFFFKKMFDFVGDDDVRVRFCNSSLVPILFEISPQSKDSTAILNTVWALLDKTLKKKQDSETTTPLLESCPTVDLLLGNIMIVSGIARRAPYGQLIRRAIKVSDQDYSWKSPIDYIHCVLDAVAARLHLKSPANLHSIYASYITRQNILEGHRNIVLPSTICGDPYKSNIADTAFKQIGAVLLSHNELNLFEQHCSKAQISSTVALKHCLPYAIAIIFLDAFELYWKIQNSDPEALSKAQQLINDLTCRLDVDGTQFIKSISDKIVVEILLRFCEENCSLDESSIIARAFADVRSGEVCRERLKVLVPRNPSFRLYRPVPPSAGAPEIVHCLSLMHMKTGILNHSAGMYNITQELLTNAWSSPFFNDKVRSLYSMAIFISMYEGTFQIPALRMILHSLVHLYQHDCLAELCPSLIQWAADKIMAEDGAIGFTWLPLLVRKAAHVAYRYSMETNLSHNATHISLLDRLGKMLSSLECKDPLSSVKKSIRAARTMWPGEFCLSDLGGDFDFGDVTGLFKQDNSLLNDAFPVMRSLLKHRLVSSHETAKFAWQIASSTSPDLVSNTASIALADILIESGCHMRKPSLHDVATLSTTEEEVNSITEPQIQQKIIGDLISLLLNPDLKLVKCVSTTLKILWNMPGVSSLFPNNTLSDHIILDAEISHLHESQNRGTSSLDDLNKSHWIQKLNDDNKWPVQFATFLADILDDTTNFYSQLVPILSGNEVFCAAAIRYFVQALLLKSLSGQNKNVPPYKTACEILSIYFTMGLKTVIKSQKNQLLIVSILNGLRQYLKPDSNLPSSGDEWLNIDWMLLAQACVRCKSYTDALMYVELEHNKRLAKKERNPGLSNSDSGTDHLRSILYEVYGNIDEPDGFYSITTVNTEERLIHQYRHEERWSESFELAAAKSEALHTVNRGPSNSRSTIPVVEALASTGFNHLAFSVLNSSLNLESRKDTEVSRYLPYELAWRGQIWDLPPVEINGKGTSESTLYSALKCVQDNERHLHKADSQINAMINQEVKKIVSSISLDRPVPETAALGCLVCLRLIQIWTSNRINTVSDSDSLDMIKKLDDLPFENLERVLLTKFTLARVSSLGKVTALSLPDVEEVKTQVKYLLRLSSAARNEGFLQTALNYVSLCQALTKSYIFELDDLTFEADEEMARILWLRGERLVAIDSMVRLLDEAGETSTRRALVLSQLGQWMTAARSRRAVEIDEIFFHPAVDIAQNLDNGQESARERATIYSRYAEFADEQLQAIDSRSSETERLRALRDRKQAEHDSFKQRINAGDSWLRKFQQSISASIQIDGQRLSDIDQQRDNFLWIALDTYAKLLECDPEAEGAVFRLVSLWFAHYNDDNLNIKLSGIFQVIPTRAFVFLSHQLSARLSIKNDSTKPFANVLYSLVLRLCQDHPFHTLYQVYSLRQNDLLQTTGDGNKSASSSLRRRSSTNDSTTPPTPAQTHRAKAAEDIFQAMRVDSRRSMIVQELERACEAFMEIAQFPQKQSSRKSYSIPENLKLRKLKNMCIPVPTVDLPVDKTCAYTEDTMPTIPFINRFSSQYKLAGGVNLPKIMHCFGSDGQGYRLLFKGGDDVRQDAVMQQVFGLVNTLLARDRETRKRQLRMRTYKVIPLIGATGILEFAGNTSPMREWLTKAHKKYHNDWSATGQARVKFENAKQKSKSVRVAEFKKIREKSPTTMRYFFIEQHKIAALWLEMRTCYSRSIATSSMVGWMLGLGDRHVSNILMDKTTGEVVHVDLGVAFDAGLLLPIPETIPFRLTAEIIDGFGMSGIEGVFRKCSEQTLRVLREKKNIITMILEVLKYDPLQKWTLTAAEVMKIQGAESAQNRSESSGVTEAEMEAGVPVEATRALVGVGEKLSNALSVAARVNELILEATDVERLAQLFVGWQPWL